MQFGFLNLLSTHSQHNTISSLLQVEEGLNVLTDWNILSF